MIFKMRKDMIVAKLTIILIVFLPIASTTSYQYSTSWNCDMAAMMTKDGYKFSQFVKQPGVFDDPEDFFDFLIRRSSANADPDGYGVIYSNEIGLFPNPNTTANQTEFYFDRAWYLKALNTTANTYYYDNYPGPMNAARGAITNTNVEDLTIVLGHVRNASSLATGSHPFRFEYDNRVYTFMHNGAIENGIKSALYTELGGVTWFEQHPSNWTSNYHEIANLIDSEILFHWIMSKTIAHNGNVFTGVLEALTSTISDYNLKIEFSQDYTNNIINFILSDGENLYVFRNTDETGPRLSWAEPQTGLFVVKTQDELAHPLGQFDFVTIPSCGELIIQADFLDRNLVESIFDKVEQCQEDEDFITDTEDLDNQTVVTGTDYISPNLSIDETLTPQVESPTLAPGPETTKLIDSATQITPTMPEVNSNVKSEQGSSSGTSSYTAAGILSSVIMVAGIFLLVWAFREILHRA